MTDPQPAARAATQPGDTAQPEQQPDDVVAAIEAASAWLGDAERPDTELPLTELAERLTTLHGHLQGALSELDRT